MAKTSTCVCIDTNLKHKAKLLQINMSQALENTLKMIIESKSDSKNIDIIKIEEELTEIQEKKEKLSIRQASLLAQKISFKENKKKENQKEIKDLVNMANMIKQSGIMGKN